MPPAIVRRSLCFVWVIHCFWSASIVASAAFFPTRTVRTGSTLLPSSSMVAFAAGVLRDGESANSKLEIPRFYPIGTPGIPWTATEDEEWKARAKRQRSYQEEVLDKLQVFQNHPSLQLHQYGALSHDPSRYPLVVVTSKDMQPNRPTLLVTGGVHGYETSGVQGAILFLQNHAADYSIQRGVNIIVAPCVSPWAYEHIQRWQADLKDPNRSFLVDDDEKDNHEESADRTTEESRALMKYLASLPETISITCHVDLHETTDTDASEFMPAKHAKLGVAYSGETIPDGFYLVGDDENPQLDFQAAIIEQVKTVTHIAPPDGNGEIIEVPLAREGVILVPATALGLCFGVTGATFKATTEVYPDSPHVTDALCNQAQVAAVQGALEYILLQKGNDKNEL